MAHDEQQSKAGGGAAAPRLRLLGTPELWIEGRAPVRLKRRDAVLLALLALDGPRSRARVAAMLWPELDDERARNNLRQRLFRLRRLGAGEWVGGETVLKLADNVTHDLRLAAGTVAELAARIAGDDALGPIDGELLGTLDYTDCAELGDWVEVARQRWREQRRAALDALAEQKERVGDIGQALRYAERLVADDPLQEHAIRRLMHLHHLRGDRAAALGVYERARILLRDVLGTRPSAQTEELQVLIRSSERPATQGAFAAPAAALGRPPRLVGRETAWQRLEAVHGAREALLVEGDAGIGKTRLLTDFASGAAGACVTGARPGDTRVPYALLARLLAVSLAAWPEILEDKAFPAWARSELARLAPELGPAAAGRLQTLRLRQAFALLLSTLRERGLSLIVLDDLHYADEATLEALPALCVRESGLAWLFGSRAAERCEGMKAWFDADAPWLQHLLLPALDAAALTELLASLRLPGLDPNAWTERLWRHTGGNPLFVLETLRAATQHGDESFADSTNLGPVPESVQSLIGRRLARLSAAALRLARAAAVAGQDFGAALASAVLGQHALDLADAWRELELAQILRGEAFAHDLVADAVAAGVPRSIARELHRAIALWLSTQQAERSDAAAVHAVRVATHWEAAGEWRQAAAAFDVAADQASAASRLTEEAELRERAAACYERAAAPSQALASRLAGAKAVLATQPQENALALTRRLLKAARNEHEMLQVLPQHINTLLVGHQAAEAAAESERALVLARRLGDDAAVCEVTQLLAVAQSLQGQAVQALGLLRGVESWLERNGSAAQRQHYWGTVGHVLRLLQRHRECAEAMARSLGLAEGLGDHAEVMVVSSNLAALYSYLGRRDYAREAAQRAWRQRDRLGEADGVAAAQVDLHMATYACMPEGRYADALDFAEAARRKLARPGAEIWAVHADNHLANLWLQIGQSARAAQVLAGAEHGASPGIRARRLHLRARLQQQLEHSGQVLLRQALELIGPTGEAPTRLPIELDLARELQSEQALALVQRVMDEAQRIEMHGVVANAAAERADTLRRAGRVDEGAKVAADALRTLAVCHPFDGYVPECLWLAARALLAAGQRAAARAALKQAAHWVAAAQVPEAFRHAFGERHRVNSGIATELMRLANSA